jgi:hypothetical protein
MVVQVIRCAISCRISWDWEGKGLGIQRHLEDCLAVAQRSGWTVVDHCIDNDTGASRYSKKKAGGSHRRGLARHSGGQSSGTPKYLLSGMVFCGSCHAELYPRKIRGKRRLLPAGAPHRAGHLQGRRRRCVQIERPMEDTRDWISRKRGEAGRLPGGSPGEDCR